MKTSIVLVAVAFGCVGCQTSPKVVDSVTSDPDQWELGAIVIGLGALDRDELSSHPTIFLVKSAASPDWQCQRLRQAFGSKTADGRPLSKTFLLGGDDQPRFQEVVDCSLAGQAYDLAGYKVVYIGPRNSFDLVAGKLKPTGAVVVPREYPQARTR